MKNTTSTIKIDNNRISAAIAILENYLDGAVPDMLNGDVENTDFVLDAIYMHKILTEVDCPFSCLIENKYEKQIREKNSN